MTQTAKTPKPIERLGEGDTPHSQPIVMPSKHQEDLGPVSDMSPESWRYNPEKIMKYYKGRPLQVLGRLFNIVIPFGLFMFANWWDSLWGNSVKNESKRAKQLKKTLTKLGPAYIKIGQAF